MPTFSFAAQVPTTRNVTALPGHLLDAGDGRDVDHLVREPRFRSDLLGDPGDQFLRTVHVLVVGDLDVEHDLGPALALVAQAQHLAVADVPDHAGRVPEPGHAQPDGLDGAGGLLHVDDVAHPELVFHEHRRPGQEVLDQVLRTEADDDAEHTRAREERRQVDAHDVEH